MNNDLISREALKRAACVKFYTSPYYKHILDLIDNAPTVNTDLSKYSDKLWKEAYERGMNERPHGEWIKEDAEHLKGWYRCSECGRRVEDLTDDVIIHAGCEDYTIADIYPYCHCGADMREETNDERRSNPIS